jgi:hypothetical protein
MGSTVQVRHNLNLSLIFSEKMDILPAPQKRSIYLLACSVEYVQEAGLPIYDDLLPVAVLYGGVVLVHEMVLDQLDGEGGLAHASRCTLY